jgi:methylisocitrate lyase
MESASVAAVHMEDQLFAKRCGHRPNKGLVSMMEMGDRLKAAVDARTDPDFVIMARTDAFALEGLEQAIARSHYYLDCGADMIFAEALTSLADFKAFTSQIQAPILANSTEFGKTPLFTRDEYAKVGVSMILYPLSAFRAMSYAALSVYQTIEASGSQASLIDKMQPRSELYEILGYLTYEKTLDHLMMEEKNAD